jgi:hypothetical protein
MAQRENWRRGGLCDCQKITWWSGAEKLVGKDEWRNGGPTERINNPRDDAGECRLTCHDDRQINAANPNKRRRSYRVSVRRMRRRRRRREEARRSSWQVEANAPTYLVRNTRRQVI